MQRTASRFLGMVFTAVLVLLAWTGLAQAAGGPGAGKTLYAVVNGYPSTSYIMAYAMDPTDGHLTWTTSYNVTGAGVGMVPLSVAYDGASGYLFVTDGSSTIYLVNTATGVCTNTPAPGAPNLRGIVVDNRNSLVYAVEPATDRLFVYRWNQVTGFTQLPGSPHTLASVGGSSANGYGLALNQSQGYLYVGNSSSTIPYYRTSNWTKVGNLGLFGTALSVGVDPVQGLVHSGASQVADYQWLQYYRVADGVKNGIDLGPQRGVQSLTVDEDSGLVYVFDGPINNELKVYQYDPSPGIAYDLLPFSPLYPGSVTGLVIGSGGGPLSLGFPLSGETPYSAPVIAVLDHDAFDKTPVRFYVKNGKVRPFGGQTGDKAYGVNRMERVWFGYMNSTQSPFQIGNSPDYLNYQGGPPGGPYTYLYYDGHPGYDYRVTKGTPILATAAGRLYLASTDPVNGGGYATAYKTMCIKHPGLQNYSTWYLYVTPTKDILDEIKRTKGRFALVAKGTQIGTASSYWFHIDFRKGGIGHANIIDPYELGLWDYTP